MVTTAKRRVRSVRSTGKTVGHVAGTKVAKVVAAKDSNLDQYMEQWNDSLKKSLVLADQRAELEALIKGCMEEEGTNKHSSKYYSNIAAASGKYIVTNIMN